MHEDNMAQLNIENLKKNTSLPPVLNASVYIYIYI